MKCWKKVDERDEYIHKDGTQIVQVTSLNGINAGQLGVSVRTKPNKLGIQSIKKEKYFGRFRYGPKKFRDNQSSQKKANEFMEKYMMENNTC